MSYLLLTKHVVASGQVVVDWKFFNDLEAARLARRQVNRESDQQAELGFPVITGPVLLQNPIVLKVETVKEEY